MYPAILAIPTFGTYYGLTTGRRGTNQPNQYFWFGGQMAW
jgi:hypothetical protein